MSSDPIQMNTPQEERLLVFLKQVLKESWSRKDLQWCIEHNRCRVNGRTERFASFRLNKNDRVSLWPAKAYFFHFEQERVLFEDYSFLVYDKPAFVCSTTIATSLNLQLVHRLDRDTTGVFILAKNSETRIAMEKLFKQRKVHKEYLALVQGHCPTEGVIEGMMAPLRRREGAVLWSMVSQNGVYSKTTYKRHLSGKSNLVSCFPLTGRTHQIRVHLKTLGCPILGDIEYGGVKQPEGLFRPLLHSSRTTFVHPFTGKELSIEAPLPDDFLSWKNSENKKPRA